ncbi:MAG TPA: site-specific integrase, partial [Candidatus Methylomirabilis sp.]|nr:site-specific integrase [Candidatus Methylomirabilis sp.]
MGAAVNAPLLTPNMAAWERVKMLVLDSVPSPESRRAYGRAVDQFLGWYIESGATGFTKATVNAYRSHLETQGLSASTVNLRLSAIRKLAAEAADNGLLAPHLAQGIARVKGVGRAGTRTGTWLTLDQAEQLL